MKIQEIILDAMYDNRKTAYWLICAGYMAFAIYMFSPLIVQGVRRYLGW